MKYLIILMLLVGCGSKDIVQKPIEIPPILEQGEIEPPRTGEESGFKNPKGIWNNAEYDRHLLEAILKVRKPFNSRVTEDFSLIDMKPKDWNKFIDVWPSSQQGKLEFWHKILVAMAARENSKFDPNKCYKENFKGRNGKYIMSCGLYQMSVSSSNAYSCKFKDQDDISTPHKAINCAVQVLAYWLYRDGVITKEKSSYKGGGRYWAVLRCVNDYTCKSLNYIKAANR